MFTPTAGASCYFSLLSLFAVSSYHASLSLPRRCSWAEQSSRAHASAIAICIGTDVRHERRLTTGTRIRSVGVDCESNDPPQSPRAWRFLVSRPSGGLTAYQRIESSLSIVCELCRTNNTVADRIAMSFCSESCLSKMTITPLWLSTPVVPDCAQSHGLFHGWPRVGRLDAYAWRGGFRLQFGSEHCALARRHSYQYSMAPPEHKSGVNKARGTKQRHSTVKQERASGAGKSRTQREDVEDCAECVSDHPKPAD